jgi:hypothetical protein
MSDHPDHTEIARAAFEQSGLQPTPPYRTVDDALRYVTRLLGLLPPNEAAGYVKAPLGGSNVSTLPDGTLVRVGRVMYPDGQIYKVMRDVPNGSPQWVAEDVQPALYVPFTGPHQTRPDAPAPDDPPAPPPDLLDEILKQIGLQNEQLARLDRRVASAERTRAADFATTLIILTRLDALEQRPPAPAAPPIVIKRPAWWPF